MALRLPSNGDIRAITSRQLNLVAKLSQRQTQVNHYLNNTPFFATDPRKKVHDVQQVGHGRRSWRSDILDVCNQVGHHRYCGQAAMYAPLARSPNSLLTT